MKCISFEIELFSNSLTLSLSFEFFLNLKIANFQGVKDLLDIFFRNFFVTEKKWSFNQVSEP